MSPTPDAAVGADRVLDALLGALSGFVTALVTFRTRLALNDQARRAERKELTDRLDRSDRLQRATLNMVADLSRAAGIDKRFSDELVRLLSEGERE